MFPQDCDELLNCCRKCRSRRSASHCKPKHAAAGAMLESAASVMGPRMSLREGVTGSMVTVNTSNVLHKPLHMHETGGMQDGNIELL
jgi:hypothetical protein